MKGVLARLATVSTRSRGDGAGSAAETPSLATGSKGDVMIGRPRRAASETAVVAEMDPRFYDADFDCSSAVLDELAADSSDGDLEQSLQLHDDLLRIVNGRLSSQIFANYAAFVSIMEGIFAIENDLADAVELVVGTRSVLAAAQRNLVAHAFGTLRLCRLRSRLRPIRDRCIALQQLASSDAELTMAIRSSDFRLALEVLDRGQRMGGCAVDLDVGVRLSQRIASGYDRLEAHLKIKLKDVLLSRALDSSSTPGLLPAVFQITDALLALEQHLGAPGRLIDAFSSSMDALFFQVVHQSATSSKQTVAPETFVELCALLQRSEFADCYRKALDAAVFSMYTFFKARQHLDDRAENGDAHRESAQRSCGVLWTRIQHRLLQILRSTKATAIETNLSEVECIYRRSIVLMRVGELFSGVSADVLELAVNDKCQEYFTSLHAQTCERLILAMECDSWQRLPLSPAFSFLDIKELKAEYAFADPLSSHRLEPDLLFEQFAAGQDPFTTFPPTILSPGAALPPPSSSSQRRSFCLTSSALLALQDLGRYTLVMRCLPILATQALVGAVDLFNLFLVGVVSVFLAEYPRFVVGHPAYEVSARRYPGLCSTINATIRARLGPSRQDPVSVREAPSASLRLMHSGSARQARNAARPPQLFKRPNIDLHQVNDLLALATRYTVLESLRRIADAFLWMKTTLMRYVTPATMVSDAIDPMSSLCNDLEEAQYWFIASKLMNETLKPLMAPIASCKWDGSNLKESANTYVDKITALFVQIKTRLDRLTELGDIDAAVAQSLAQSTMRIAMDSLVDAFSSVKRCSTEGRASMSLDVSVLQRALQDVFGIWPIPGAARLDDYIKAFYLPADDLLDWVASHRGEFTLDHHLGLARVSSAAMTIKPKNQSEFLDRVAKRCTSDSGSGRRP